MGGRQWSGLAIEARPSPKQEAWSPCPLNQLTFPPEPVRRGSDAEAPDHVSEFTLDQFYQAIRNTRRTRMPRWVELWVRPVLLDESIPIEADDEASEAPATVLSTDDEGGLYAHQAPSTCARCPCVYSHA